MNDSEGKPGEQEWRPPKADFLPSFSALEAAVREGCGAEATWEGQVAGGVVAALRFVDANPDAAHALTIDARRRDSDRGSRQDDVIRHFGSLLWERVPEDRRGPESVADGIVESIAVLVRGHLVTPTSAPLASRLADAVYLTLVAFADEGVAARWAERLEGADG